MTTLDATVWWSICIALSACVNQASSTTASPANDANNATSLPPASMPSASASADPCRGQALDVDQLRKACIHKRPDEAAPPGSVLRMELEGPTQPLVSGGNTAAWVRFRNVSAAPVTFQLNGTCSELFGVYILRRDGGRADIENEVGGLGLCGTDPGIRVELTPGGVLSKKLTVSARAQRWAEVTPGKENSMLELGPGSPIAPGAYTLDVAVPVYTDKQEGRVHLKTALNIVAAK